MVTIVSEDVDITTKTVIDWLLFHNENYKILGSNKINTIDSFTINNNKLTLKINGIDFSKVSNSSFAHLKPPILVEK